MTCYRDRGAVAVFVVAQAIDHEVVSSGGQGGEQCCEGEEEKFFHKHKSGGRVVSSVRHTIPDFSFRKEVIETTNKSVRIMF